MNGNNNDREDLMWQEVDREKIAECRIFDVYKVRRRSKNNGAGDFFLLDAPDWITVVPVIEVPVKGVKCPGESSFLMVEQYRHGSDMVTIEFPAGTVDPGETPETTAARELLEETGYEARELIKLGEICPNPAFQNNLNHFFLARGLRFKQGQELDEHEEIVIREIGAAEVFDKMGTGRYNNGTMLMALAFYRRWLDERSNKTEPGKNNKE